MLIDSCITQLKAQIPSRTCNESKEEEGVGGSTELLELVGAVHGKARLFFFFIILKPRVE